MGDAVRERVDIAVDAVGLLHLAREPILGDQPFLAHDELVERRHDLRMGVWRDFPVVRNLADFPKPFDGGGAPGEGCNARIVAGKLQRFEIVCGPGADETGIIWDLAETVLEAVDAVEIKLRAAPLKDVDWFEIVVFELVDEFLVEGLHIACDAECAVVEMPAGAARDLGKLGGRQIAMHAPIEFAGAGECDVIHIEIEAHADRVGRDKEIHVARLIESDLRVARARAQCAEHDRRTSALPADEFRDRVDIAGREGNDSRPALQPRNFLLARIGQLGQARAGDEIRARYQFADRVAHRLSAEKQRFAHTARVEETIGENVTAIGVGRELNFVDRQKIHLHVARHRLDRADIVAGTLRLDLLFAGYECHVSRPDPGDDLIVDFTRQEPQRQSYQPAFMPEHSLDREVCLACIRRSQHRRYMPGLGGLYDSRLRCCAHKRTFCQNRKLRSILSGFGAVNVRRGAPAAIEQAGLPKQRPLSFSFISQ